MSEELFECIKNRLQKPLPGIMSQIKMAPHPAGMTGDELLNEYKKFRITDPPPTARMSAVMILFYYSDGRLYFPLILRPTYRGVHSGQVSFPGGSYEKEDKNLLQTALRECYEEIGVDKSCIEIFGSLTDIYIEPSNFFVSPRVGWCNKLPEFKIDPDEVEELIEISVDELIGSRVAFRKKKKDGKKYSIPFFDIQDRFIWGATAMILSELKDILQECFN